MIISRGICCLKLLQRSSIILNSSAGTQIRKSHGTWSYRDTMVHDSEKNNKNATIISSLIWGWIIYHFINNPDLIYGEFIEPDPSSWTDEELGIPSDDA